MEVPWTDVAVNGFCLLRSAVSPSLLKTLTLEVERLTVEHAEQAHGLRGLLSLSPIIRAEAERFFGVQLGTDGARPIRGILFDKKPDANWRIGWHQDTNLKEGGRLLVSNDQLPQVFTLRLHLDPTPSSNGALRCLPGSHLGGRQVDFRREEYERSDHVIEADPGDVLLMRPLLFHASSPATEPAQRRVIHVDYLQRR